MAKNQNEKTRIIKTKKIGNFSIIDNCSLHNQGISFKATGLMAYLLSLPDDWEIHLSEIETRKTDGRDSVRAAFRECIQAGYIDRMTQRQGGRFFVSYIVYESLLLKNLENALGCDLSVHRDGFSGAVKPTRLNRRGLTDAVNPQLVNTNIVITDKLNTKEVRTERVKEKNEKLNHMNFFDKFYKKMEEKKYSPSLRDSYDSKIINLHIEEDKLTIEFDSLVRTADKLFELSARRDELSEFALRSTGVQNPEYSISFLNQKRKAINNAYSEIPASKPQSKNIQTIEKPRQAVLYNSWEALIAWSKRSGMSRDIMEELGKIKTRVEANCVYLDTIVSERAKILIEKYFSEGEPPVKLIFKK